MSRTTLLRTFRDTFESHFDESFDGDEEAVLDALELAEEETGEAWDEQVLADAFEERAIADSDTWPADFWAELAVALDAP